jgi:tetratricopeptide (TPR) repeat protein
MGIGAYSIFGGREEATSQPASTATETTLPKLTTVYPEKKLAPTEKDQVPTTKRISALEKVRIVGLLRGAEAALKENRLQLPKGDNAYEKYQDVLRIDPDNREAKRGLLNVASRYLALSEQALERGDVQKAVSYLSQASSVAPHHPRFESVRARVNHAAEG